ncbi:hypothetical protein PVK64_17800 [Aliivibrio sp. S4TY2]|uniref:hypothetical protein n=1 Tax=unclassified Aliivibrio TaxID=2645654 RepID=UPI00237825C5|nr:MULTISPECIES: hypothetical protein [unclassified Aliivibrio]MDD9158020.1 hypothetical protein [Aliivibrio sp. S4TY2]MDD9161937.1 hypothetical protein [Aliivibrio sp. S4TY1]MDD9166017.1 hypothetical protein [Aliivibrio sp. S4MY2]MDD9170017.1 hypothetical protein [Aliivibrio sp. S4MY4]MDD9187068.1 hypothetical protein [Aliivibrio sp. S4MY3]
MKKIYMLITLLSFSSISNAAFNSNNGQEVYVCTLQPFNDIFADVGITEDIARYKVGKRCEIKQGGNSIFCKPKDASCSVSYLTGMSESYKSLTIYSDKFQRGIALNITGNESDLTRHNFNDSMSSFLIPVGWTVRFYENKNYEGGYYTRKNGKGNAQGFDKKISSIQILSKN